MSRTKDAALHAQRQQEILLAAAQVFKAKGFHLARTEDICAAAQLSAGTVFRHFPDKHAMIRAIAEIEVAQYTAQIEQLATPQGIRWLAQITATDLTELLQSTAFELGADSWLELSRDPQSRKQLLAFDKRMRQKLTGALAQGQKEGWVRTGVNCAGMAHLVLALFSGLMFDTEIGLPVDTQATARAMSDLFGTLLAT
jgi:TetR/AcrR family transcriptional regulator, repressor for uid operon